MVPAFIIVSFSWSLCALLWPSPLNSDPTPVREILLLMGLVFLAAGVLLYRLKGSAWNRLFICYCCAAAIHWAGPLGNNSGLLDQLLLAVYIMSGIILFGSLFLHLALSYPARRSSISILLLVYLPLAAGALLFASTFAGGPGEDLMPSLFLLGSAYGFGAGLVWLYRLWVSRNLGLPQQQASLLTLALIAGWLPNMLVQYGVLDLGQFGGLTNLSLLFMLAALCWIGSKGGAEPHYGPG